MVNGDYITHSRSTLPRNFHLSLMERSKKASHELMGSVRVLKFGGTSVGNVSRIQSVAKIIQKQIDQGHSPVVVLSAMSGQTNRLVELAREISDHPPMDAYDMLLSSGEQVSCALMTMALDKLEISAEALLAFQVGLRTNQQHSKARIESIDTERLEHLLSKNVVPIIAGFQGIYRGEGQFDRITTLGRGGSDTTAVAIAAALKAEQCEIYTDVNGIYQADPRIVPEAKPIQEISFAEMMEMASLGAKVLHMRSVELAAKYQIPLIVKCTFQPDDNGTRVVGENTMLESPVVSAVTSSKTESLVKIQVPQSTAEYPADIFEKLSQHGVNVDIITRLPSKEESIDLSLSVPRDESAQTLEALSDYSPEITIPLAAKVSVVGIGMKSYSGVAAKVFKSLEKEKIPIQLITTSEIKISVVIDEKDHDRAVKALHEAFLNI